MISHFHCHTKSITEICENDLLQNIFMIQMTSDSQPRYSQTIKTESAMQRCINSKKKIKIKVMMITIKHFFMISHHSKQQTIYHFFHKMLLTILWIPQCERLHFKDKTFIQSVSKLWCSQSFSEKSVWWMNNMHKSLFSDGALLISFNASTAAVDNKGHCSQSLRMWPTSSRIQFENPAH